MSKKQQQKTLKDEVQVDSGVKELAEKVERLETAAQQKRQNAQKMQDTITQKRQEAQEAQSKAQKAMSKGDDPLPHAKRAAELENEVKHLESLLPDDAHTDPAAQELNKIRETTPALKGRITMAIKKSAAATEIAEAVRKKLNEVKALVEQYDREVAEIMGEHSLKTNEYVDLNIEDENLNTWMIRRFPLMAIANPPHPMAGIKQEPAKQPETPESEEKAPEPMSWQIDTSAEEREKRPPQAKRNASEI